MNYLLCQVWKEAAGIVRSCTAFLFSVYYHSLEGTLS